MTSNASYTLLAAELAAIEHWDRDYFQTKNHDRNEVSAYESRKRRRDEILKQIGESEAVS